MHAMSLIGRDLSDSQNWGSYMRSIGFTNIVEKLAYVPVNPWPKGKKNKILGAMSLQNLTEGIASLSTAAFTRVLGWEKERVEELLESSRKDLADKNVHAYVVVYFCYGQKPVGDVVEGEVEMEG